MAGFAEMRTLDVWYAHVSEDQLRRGALLGPRPRPSARGRARARSATKDQADREGGEEVEKRLDKNAAKARSRNSMQALAKLTEVVDGSYRIVSEPPVIVPARDLFETYGIDPERSRRSSSSSSRVPLDPAPDRRQLLERFEVVDWARKVVGVGSVGTRAFIALLQGRTRRTPCSSRSRRRRSPSSRARRRKSRFRQAGERVVRASA